MPIEIKPDTSVKITASNSSGVITYDYLGIRTLHAVAQHLSHLENSLYWDVACILDGSTVTKRELRDQYNQNWGTRNGNFKKKGMYTNRY